ncbi:MAG: AAA family ATPase [Desulfuromonas sp.]|nr:AAA family ATPase [Desulfuromonas sp.]
MRENLTTNNFAQHVAAGTPLLAISTDNEQRACNLIKNAATRAIKGLGEPQIWSCDGGFANNQSADPVAALRWVMQQPEHGVYIFLDMQWYWDSNPEIQRLLIQFAQQRSNVRKCLVFIASEISIPSALSNHIVHLSQPMPNAAEITAFLQNSRTNDQFLDKILEQEDALRQMVLAAQGLDLIRLERALRLAKLTRSQQLQEVVAALHRDKKQALEQTGIIEFIDNNLKDSQVGGMGNLKKWMEKREKAFGTAELAQGQNLPSGVLLMGISGCGKSLFVKAIAARWSLPLVRLDMATIYSGTHGTPEQSLHHACQLAEAMAPCVLWIDEIESGISEQGFKSGGGSSSRVLGYFLTWMQEKSSPVFVAATANAIETLPAEVLRKGRFDEIFYIALPGLAERQEIFRIHLSAHGLDAESFDPQTLSHSSKGFSGAEIEQAVSSACFEALASQRPMTPRDIMEAIGRTVPISVTMAEQIKKIEAWAFKRAVPASDQAERA